MSDTYEELKQLPRKYPGPKTLSANIQYLMGCRSPEQFAATLRALLNPREFCPFCRIDLVRNKPLAEHGQWYLKHNDFPKKHMHAQLLILPRRHLTDPEQLSPDDGAQIFSLFHKSLRLPGIIIPGGGLFMRFGNPANHAGSIPHLHVNILSPTGETEHREPLTKKPEDREANYQRMISHWNLVLDKGGLPWLFSSEGIAFSTT